LIFSLALSTEVNKVYKYEMFKNKNSLCIVLLSLRIAAKFFLLAPAAGAPPSIGCWRYRARHAVFLYNEILATPLTDALVVLRTVSQTACALAQVKIFS
jgi:hypothetical protein